MTISYSVVGSYLVQEVNEKMSNHTKKYSLFEHTMIVSMDNSRALVVSH